MPLNQKIKINPKAQQRINECRRIRNPYLDLSGCNLHEIPEEVYTMTWIEVLDFSPDYYFEKTFWGILQKHLLEAVLAGKTIESYGDLWLEIIFQIIDNWTSIFIKRNLPSTKNHLSSIDERILQLPNLRALLLADNPLKKFPEHIAQLQQLQFLYLSNNQLSEIPQHIAQLQQLQFLSLTGNQLSEIPQHIAQLQQLQFLYLSNNQLSEIPQHIAQLQQLQVLSLTGNQLSEIPQHIAQLQQLQFLSLTGNQLSEIPQHIAQLQQLQVLYLDNNQLSEIPQHIAQLQQLQVLSLTGNQLSEIPQHIAQLQQLQVLYLDNNQLSEIPQHIAQLQQLQFLSLTGNQLSEIPQHIAQLQQLQVLDLSNNQLSEIPQHIAQLQQLQVLYLSNNQLSEIPQHIAQLQQLQFLSLTGNQLSEIPQHIAQLQQLQFLSLTGNQLSEIPQHIAQLQQLQFLSLTGNQLSEIPQHIAQLQQLQFLSLTGNQLSEIPQHIAQLQQLQVLDLSNNQLSEIPQHIAQLQQLQVLSLSNNQLSEIPQHIAQLQQLQVLYLDNNQLSIVKGWLADMPSLLDLRLAKNPIENIPNEVFDKSGNRLSTLKEYFDSLREDSQRLFEAKVLIVGEGGVGKTSLRLKLEDVGYLAAEGKTDSTEGIVISQQPYSDGWGGSQRDFVLHIWDFGGQEVYHATHQFFLTRRSLYLLVWDSRKDARQSDFEYWLNIIRLLSENSPVLMVKNKFDQRHIDIAESQWRQGFDNLREFLTINCSQPNHQAMQRLWDAIKYQIRQLDHIGDLWGQDRIDIRRALETKAQERPFISFEAYLEICSKEGGIQSEESALILSDYLHNLGVILHFQEDEYLQETVILRPEWGTAAVYKILDDPILQQKKGILHFRDLSARIWGKDDPKHDWKAADYPQYKYRTLLRLMHRFELCFPLEHTQGKQFIVPELLKGTAPKPLNQEPFLKSTTDRPVLQLVFDYPVFMPKGIVNRLMVRLYTFIEGQTYWRRGVVFDYPRHQARALVVQNDVDKRIYVRSIGKDRKYLLSIIRQHIRTIHDRFGKELKVDEKIPCNCSECIHTKEPYFFKSEQIEKYRKKGVLEIRCGKSVEEVSIPKLVSDFPLSSSSPTAKGRFLDRLSDNILDERAAFAAQEEIPITPPKVFIAYDYKDKALLDKLLTQLSPLTRNDQIQTWSTDDTLAGEKHSQKLDKELKEASIVLLLISADFIASDLCHNHILTIAMKRHEAQAACVIPVYVRPCVCEDFAFDQLLALPNKPNFPKFVTQWENEDEAWMNVAEGLKKVVKEFS